MPNVRRVYLNDNIRTEHLKCRTCRTRVFLVKIEQDRDGDEVRTFGCPHCAVCRSVRLAPPAYARPSAELSRGTEPRDVLIRL